MTDKKYFVLTDEEHPGQKNVRIVYEGDDEDEALKVAGVYRFSRLYNLIVGGENCTISRRELGFGQSAGVVRAMIFPRKVLETLLLRF